MICQNDPVGKTRFQLIQDRWIGGDVTGELYKVNFPQDYKKIVETSVFGRNIRIRELMGNKIYGL